MRQQLERASRSSIRRGLDTRAESSQRPNPRMRPTSEAAVSREHALGMTGGLERYASEPRSSIVALGLAVQSAPVELREQLAVTSEEEWPRAIAHMCAWPHVEEAAVLSTCNRFEVYAVALSWHRGVRELEQWLSDRSGIPLHELRPYLFLLRDRDATQHVLRVSAGLESLVMGEGQILSQVKEVYRFGQDATGFGRHMNGLFKAAVTAGKRVRTETSIASGAVSVSSAAVELADLKLPTNGFDGASVMVIGAGSMARLIVRHLSGKGVVSVTVVNRSIEGAESLAEEVEGMEVHAKTLDELEQAADNCDTIFTASGAQEPLLTKEVCERLGEASESVNGMRRIFDIAVPRNASSDINELEQTTVFNVDDLREVVDKNVEAREQAAAEAEKVLSEELQNFEAWRDSLETVPTIKRLRGKAELIRSQELEKAMKKLGDSMSKKQMKTVEELTKGVVNKLLHGPMQALRPDGSDATTVGQTLVNMHALERMFNLSEEDNSPHVQQQQEQEKEKASR